VPTESDTAREFNEIAKRIVPGKANPQEWEQAAPSVELLVQATGTK
jgi:hypothetical protein